MHFFSAATLTALAVSVTGVLAAPAPSDNPQSLDELRGTFEKALAQIDEAQTAKNDGLDKRQPGGGTCLVGGDAACWGSCFVQTGCGGYCADQTNICTCHNC